MEKKHRVGRSEEISQQFKHLLIPLSDAATVHQKGGIPKYQMKELKKAFESNMGKINYAEINRLGLKKVFEIFVTDAANLDWDNKENVLRILEAANEIAAKLVPMK
jgi:hypothetical protein